MAKAEPADFTQLVRMQNTYGGPVRFQLRIGERKKDYEVAANGFADVPEVYTRPRIVGTNKLPSAMAMLAPHMKIVAPDAAPAAAPTSEVKPKASKSAPVDGVPEK
jgi:hypothetical protein